MSLQDRSKRGRDKTRWQTGTISPKDSNVGIEGLHLLGKSLRILEPVMTGLEVHQRQVNRTAARM